MYNTGKLVSIKRVVEKVYRDYPFTDIQWADIIEWISEGINLLGVAPSYIDKVSEELTLVNGRAELPCDVMYIKGVRDFETQEVLIRSFDQFHSSNYFRCSDEQVATHEDYCHPVNTYITNSNFIYTSYDEGSLEISYKAMPTDEDGLPMIPDDDKYIRAMAAYVAERIITRQFYQGKVAAGILQHVERERDWAFGSAKNKMVIPDMDGMEAWKNGFLRLIPNFSAHSASFKFLSQPSQQRNHNSY
jgi:hypothetical protein